MKRAPYRERGGAALLLALWALFLLSAMVISWALNINSRLTLNANSARVLEAEAMAASGSEIAMHPATKPGSPLLRGGVSRTQTYEARMIGEGGRLNINVLMTKPEGQELVRRYLEFKGVELNDRERMIDCLLDWMDPDNLVRLNGAEAEDNYRPRNAPLARIEELKRVKGWAEFTSRPDWDKDFTLDSQMGLIDVRWASRDVLLALGVGEQAVDQFLQLRAGADGIDGTEDDPELKGGEDVAVALGLSGPQYAALAPLIASRDPTMRIVSVGRSGNVTRTVQMIVIKTGATPTLKPGTWKEL